MVARDVRQVRARRAVRPVRPGRTGRRPRSARAGTTHDLAAHLWIRETDPVGAGGIVARPLAGLLERRMAEVKQRWPFAELVDRVRNGPARLLGVRHPGRGRGRQHHRVLRPPRGRPPRRRRTRSRPADLGAEVEEWMWRRLKLLARAWFRRAQVGVVLERLGSVNDGRRARDDPGRRRQPDRHRRRAAERADAVRPRARRRSPRSSWSASPRRSRP